VHQRGPAHAPLGHLGQPDRIGPIFSELEDVRDARHLARLLHLGQIVEVAIPGVEQEAARDLVRARDDCRGDLMAVRHRLSKLLLRQGIVYYGGKTWNGTHELWLRRQRFDSPALQLAYDTSFDAMLAIVDRRDRLDRAIMQMAAASMFTPVVTRLGCMRGISTLTAFGLAVEIGDWHRLTGRSIGTYLGLVPTEHSSGSTRHGGITKTGNGHARRLLIEAAWHHRPRYRPDVICDGAGMPHRWRPERAERQPISASTPAGPVLITAGNTP
jgi:transposase